MALWLLNESLFFPGFLVSCSNFGFFVVKLSLFKASRSSGERQRVDFASNDESTRWRSRPQSH